MGRAPGASPLMSPSGYDRSTMTSHAVRYYITDRRAAGAVKQYARNAYYPEREPDTAKVEEEAFAD